MQKRKGSVSRDSSVQKTFLSGSTATNSLPLSPPGIPRDARVKSGWGLGKGKKKEAEEMDVWLFAAKGEFLRFPSGQ